MFFIAGLPDECQLLAGSIQHEPSPQEEQEPVGPRHHAGGVGRTVAKLLRHRAACRSAQRSIPKMSGRPPELQ
jgi:hypothetical protein